MRKILRLLLIASIPVFVFMNVYQSYLYQKLDRSVTNLESQEKAWLENNKRVIAGIAVLRSPARIDQIARDQLKLTQQLLDPVLRVRLPAARGANNG